MMELKVEYWSLEELLPYAGNPRVNDHAVEAVAQAIQEFGFRIPVVIRGDGEVVDGHLRLKAAQHIGLENIPVVRADDLSDEQVKAFRISVNRMAELADWDLDLLKVELQDLDQMGFSVDLTGLDEDLLLQMLPEIHPTAGLTDPDEIPDIPDEHVTRPGDLWILGHHRLLCGDSTSKGDVTRLMDGRQAHMVFTDPPYNVSYVGKNKKRMTIENDSMKSDDFYRFLLASFSNMSAATLPGSAFYVCHADIEAINFRKALSMSGWLLKQSLIWVKSQFILGRQDYHWQHEPILYGWKEGAAHRWYGNRKQSTVIEQTDMVSVVEVPGEGYQLSITDGVESVVVNVPSFKVVSALNGVRDTVWRVPKPAHNDEHPTMKPVALVDRAIQNSSRNGEVVLDLFAGAGSTLIACEQVGRRCYGMELDPRYADVIKTRWENFTGLNAKRVEGESRGNDEAVTRHSGAAG